MEITGFDEQIGVVRKGVKALKKANTFLNKITPKPKIVAIKKPIVPTRVVTTTKTVAPVKKGGVFNKLKPSQIRVAPTKVVTTTRTVAPAKRGGVFNKLKPSQIRVAPTRAVAPAKTVAVRRAELIKMIQAKKTANVVKPTTPSKIVTAKQFSKLKSAPVARPTMVTKPSAPVKVFSTDGSLRNVTPSALKQMNDVQRSFARVDLPFQAVTPPTKRMRVKNTPLNLPININMIEPPVDAGVQDYYGK